MAISEQTHAAFAAQLTEACAGTQRAEHALIVSVRIACRVAARDGDCTLAARLFTERALPARFRSAARLMADWLTCDDAAFAGMNRGRVLINPEQSGFYEERRRAHRATLRLVDGGQPYMVSRFQQRSRLLEMETSSLAELLSDVGYVPTPRRAVTTRAALSRIQRETWENVMLQSQVIQLLSENL